MSAPSHLTCLCGLINEPASLLASQSLPEESCICYCDTCRHSTGSLGAWYLTLNDSPSEKSLSNTTSYRTSPKYTRFFCRGCGCNAFIKSVVDERWSACAGIVEMKASENEAKQEKGGTNVSKIMFHEYVADAKDGGMAPFLTKLGDRDVPCYRTEPEGEDAKVIQEGELHNLQEASFHPPSSTTESRGEMLEASCHCGSCQFRIAAPPYNDSSEGWYIPKADRNRYYARLCGCRSCRLTLGFTLQPWTYVPPSQIFTTANQPVMFGPDGKDTVQIEKMKHYQSSESVLRSFCSKCGATLFYQSFDRPYIIDVSVGVLRSKVGNAMVGEWLEWDRRAISHQAEAVDEELVRAWLEE